MKEIGLIEANVMIAEDRILSVSPFFATNPDKSGDSKKVAYYKDIMTDVAPQATFFYESENNLMNLTKQRRRWMNGTVASYIWFLYKKPKLICNHFNISLFKKIMLWYLFIVQTYCYFFVFLSPAIFIVAFKVAVDKLNLPNDIGASFYWIIILGLYVAFSIMSSLRLVKDWTLYIALLVGMVVQAVTIISLGYNVVLSYLPKEKTEIINGVNTTTFGPSATVLDTGVLGLVLIFMILPVIGAFIASPWSFCQILRSGLQFLLFLPTMVGVIGVYSITHFSDFSWGNRDSSGSEEKLGARKNILAERGNTIGWIFLLGNIVLCIVGVILYDKFDLFRPITTGILFIPPLTVFILSFCYFVYWRIKWCCCCCNFTNKYMKIESEEQNISIAHYEEQYKLKLMTNETRDI